VSTIGVVQGVFVRESKATGTVQARTYPLTFSRAGHVAQVFVKEGQRVAVGAVLAELGIQDLQLKLQSAMNNLVLTQVRLHANQDAAKANRTKIRLNLAATSQRLKSKQTLFDVGAIARVEIEEATRSIADLRVQLELLEAQHVSEQTELEMQLAARKAEIRSLQQGQAQSQLRAPVTGTIAKVSFMAGTHTAQNTIDLIEDATVNIKVRLAETDAALVKPGQPATVDLDAVQNQLLLGRVERLAVQGETISGQGGSTNLPVLLRLLSPEARAMARPGLTASVRIVTLHIPNALMIPLETLLVENGGVFVWLLKPINENQTTQTARFKLLKKPVKVIARNQTNAAISGVQAGAQVVKMPSENLKSGDQVTIEANRIQP
jgi:HlyD family secretion protein